jgi:molybdenum cofactor biosynthesis enzyme MoaA
VNNLLHIAYTNLCAIQSVNDQEGYAMCTVKDARDLEVTLIKLMETQSINQDDYNLIHKYLVKINNDLKLQTN